MKSTREVQSPIEELIALSDTEKARTVAEFDKEFAMDTFGPLTPAQRRLWQKAKRHMRRERGRPVQCQGHKVISVSLEKGLLKRADSFAKKAIMTRAALIARGLEAVLSGKSRSTAA
jgi:hypothetical protein